MTKVGMCAARRGSKCEVALAAVDLANGHSRETAKCLDALVCVLEDDRIPARAEAAEHPCVVSEWRPAIL